jgi:DNA-binding MarR family transcriptional regulator
MPQPPPDPFDLAGGAVTRRLGTGLAKIGLAIKSRAWHEAGRVRVTPTQGQALAVLRARPALRLDALAAELGVTAPTASDAVSALVAKQLVRRERSPTDGRAVVLTLTPAGAALADEIAGWPDFLVRALDTLDAAEQTTLLRTLTRIIHGLQQAGDIPVQRMCTSCVYFRPHVHDGPAPHHCAFVDAAFGDRELRLDCPDQQPAAPPDAALLWSRWTTPHHQPATQEDL